MPINFQEPTSTHMSCFFYYCLLLYKLLNKKCGKVHTNSNFQSHYIKFMSLKIINLSRIVHLNDFVSKNVFDYLIFVTPRKVRVFKMTFNIHTLLEGGCDVWFIWKVTTSDLKGKKSKKKQNFSSYPSKSHPFDLDYHFKIAE